MSVSFTEEQVRRIIREELVRVVAEDVDHEGITSVVSGASKLLKALTAFRETATADAVNAVSPAIDDISRSLEDMVSNPGSYVARPSTQRSVSFKAQSQE